MARTHKSVISEAMRLLGSRTSDKKATTSAANGKRGGRPRADLSATFHDDGTVTYWNVYDQTWHRRCSAIADRELAAMPADERERVIAHFAARVRRELGDE